MTEQHIIYLNKEKGKPEWQIDSKNISNVNTCKGGVEILLLKPEKKISVNCLNYFILTILGYKSVYTCRRPTGHKKNFGRI